MDPHTNPPDLSNLPSGTILFYEVVFKQGPPDHLIEFVESRWCPYNSLVPANGYSQLMQAKKNVFDFATKHIKQFEDANPNLVCFYVKTIWHTDHTSREIVTAYMKGLDVPGVPSSF
ncbi:MAG: hypothetical protein HQM08_30740 [Candidatus Riflebacteria bacterium]|nr:hypothetical protein [Candidatus Riflebacteria bacterium]